MDENSSEILLSNRNNFQSYPFIHIYHATDLGGVHPYRSYPINDNYLKETWTMEMIENIETLNRILHFPQHKFWSQIIYDGNIKEFIEKYIKISPKNFEKKLVELDASGSDIEEKLFELVFYLYLRLSTPKNHLDGNINTFTQDHFAQIIYKNKIFSPDVIYDLCTLYGTSNHIILNKMIKYITITQNKCKLDFDEFTNSFIQDLQETCLALLNFVENLLNGGEDILISQTQLAQYLIIIFDKLYSLLAVGKVYPDLYALLSTLGFGKKLGWINDTVLQELKDNLKKIPLVMTSFEIHSMGVLKFIKVLSTMTINLYRNLITSHVPYLQQSSETKGDLNDKSEFQIYLDFIMELLEFKDFTKRYNSKYPISQDLVKLSEREHSSEDDIRLAFLHSTLLTLSPPKNILPKALPFSHANTLPTLEDVSITNSVLRDEPGPSRSFEETCSSTSPSRSMDPAIALNIPKIRDFFPHMDLDIVARCLTYYENNPDLVINAILEENLPPHLCQELKPEPDHDVGRSAVSQDITNHPRAIVPQSNFQEEGNVITKRFLAERPEDWFAEDSEEESPSSLIKDSGRPKISPLPNIEYDDEFDDTTYADYNRPQTTFKGIPENTNTLNVARKWKPDNVSDEEGFGEDGTETSLGTFGNSKVYGKPQNPDTSLSLNGIKAGFGRGKSTNFAGNRSQDIENKQPTSTQNDGGDSIGKGKKIGSQDKADEKKPQQDRRFSYKEKNKSHLGNHDRKSRATQKMSKGMF